MEEKDMIARLDEEEKKIAGVYKDKNNLERRYQYFIMILIGLLSFASGILFQSERTTKTIAVHGVKVETLEKNYDKILTRLDDIQKSINKEN